MRKFKKLTAVSGFLSAAVLVTPAWAADTRPRAMPGSLNYVEGQASIGSETLDSKSIGSAELRPGQTLSTGTGKAEILLTPGVFLRLGDNSSATMISPSLTNTEVELTQGETMVEVAELHRENNLQIVEDGRATDLLKKGLYEFDAEHQQVRVFDGQAAAHDGNKQIKIKGGHELDFAAGEPLKPKKFDKKIYEDTDLYRWTSLRSSYLAEANADAARTYVVGGGWVGDGWYWDPWFGAYTWIPGDGLFYSPFGWGFYSPGFVWGAPAFYGGRFYHHFGPDYHAWAPGVHYGMPSNYGHGVYYGPRSGANGGGFHGGGGFHRGEGFHGGGGVLGGGGFHGGGGGGGHR